MNKKIIFLVSAISTLILVCWFIVASKFVSWDFRNNLWAPAYLLIHRQSPYNISGLFSECTAVWFPQIIGVFFPLGLLSQNQASNLWLIINLLTITGLTYVLINQVKQKQANSLIFGIVLLGVLFYPATIVHLILGQVDFLLIAAMLIGVYGIEKHNAPLAALCFALALSKPQICLLVIPGAFIYCILNGKWKFSFLLVLLTGAFVIAMTIPLWVFDSGWVKDFISNVRSLPTWSQPTLLSQIKAHFGRQGYVMWFFVAIPCLVASTVLWNKYTPHLAALWSLGLTTIASPYLWSWDFTLLIPLFIYSAVRLTKVYTRLILFSCWAASIFLSIWSHQYDDGDNRLWWMPLLMLLGLGICILLENLGKTNSIPTAQ